jgi:sialidase-1
VIRGQDGTILLIFMRRHSVGAFDNTFHVWKSADEGETFEPYSTFAERAAYNLCNAVVKRLRSGRLLLPTAVPAAAEGELASSFAIAVLYSDNDGLTWQEADNRLYLPMRGAMEPHVEEIAVGRLVLVMRNQLGSLFLSESTDGGLSWSKPQTSGLRTPESCPELTRIPETGDLLMIWNNSEYDPSFSSQSYGKRSPLSWAVSRDGGRTWSEARPIEGDERRAYSNPGCRFTSAGAIINYWTCEYTPEWRLNHKIDLRVAVIGASSFYDSEGE